MATVYYMRAFDQGGADAWVYWTTTVPTATPSAGDTTPNYTGTLILTSIVHMRQEDGADKDAQFILTATTSSLANERALAAGTGITAIDGGAGSNITLAVNDSVVATVSGTHFSENITVVGTGSFEFGISGSLTTLVDGRSYIAAGSNITVASASNGQVVISSTGGGGAPADAQYLVLAADLTLSDERVFVAGTGLSLADGGAGGNATLSINDSVVATVSGTTFTGATLHNAGISGSLTRLVDETSYLVAGTNITIASASNGQITISSTGGGGAPIDAQYVVLATDLTLSDERALVAGTGLSLADGGAGGNATLTINDSIVATVSGTHFSENITVVGTGSFEFGISGSLTTLTDGRSYIVAGTNVTVASSSNGQVVISSTGGEGGGAPTDAQYVVLASNGTLSAERVLTAGVGIIITDGGSP
jgi:hypothetical protein